MKRTKRIMAVALATAMALSSFALGTGTITAEAASKQNVITKATYNSGATVKYSYNKKGLITKSVSTSSKKTATTDVSTKVTTTYKYNKKNKISSKTAKTVEAVTSYDTDKTTGLTIKGKTGTVTTTTTAVTKYTYNKKGLATEAVTTTTTGKSGSETSSSKQRNYYGTELADGRYLAYYNDYNADGTYNRENTLANAYFYTGAVSYNERDVVTTTTYTDNGNGSYKTTKVSTTPNPYTPMKREYVETYYNKSIVDGVVKMTQLTKDENGNYKAPDGTSSYANVTIVSEVKVSVDPEGSASSETTTVTTDTTNENKSVATTKYSYDKKKRVKKAVTTTVDTGKTATTTTTNVVYTGKTSSSNETTVNDSEYTREETSVSTTTYTYDKKGRAKKVVTSSDGKDDIVITDASKETSYSYDSTSTATDGTVTTNKESRSQAAYGDVDKTVYKDGVKTESTIHNPYSTTSTETDSDGKTSSKTYDYSYSATGCEKVVYSRVYTDGSKYSSTTYYPDNYSKAPAFGYTRAEIDVNSSGSTETTSYSYYDGVASAKTDEARGKVEAVVAAFNAAPAVTPYESVDSTEADIATPSKSTTTYAYDKNGNVKSAKESGTRTSIDTVYNETYGNTIYEFDANGKLHAKQVATTHKYTNKNAMENTVKKGTKVLSKSLTMKTSTNDRSKSSGYSLAKRVVYAVKSKKASAASTAKKQQWILQNGRLNGEVGLN